MKFLDFTLPTPAENLACDEALLDLCEEDGVEVLRLWESHQHFVVLGYANKCASEVNAEECHRRRVPILRRCSGGGTVVQGPGCLSYNLTLQIPESGPLTTVTGTNEFIMERHRAALEKLLGRAIAVKGHTDLTFKNQARAAKEAPPESAWLKFSGNAQRRRRNALVFHGTILYTFDCSLIDALLHSPSKQPDYRDGRTHHEFVSNIPCEAVALKETLRMAWRANEPFAEVPTERIQRLVSERYSLEQWNLGQ